MPKFFNYSKVSGFTLVEIMLTIGIIVILTLAVLPSVGNFADSNLLNQTLQNIASDIENTRFKALSGSYNNSARVYWGFNCLNTTSYSLSAYNTASPYTYIPTNSRTQTLPNNVTISCSGTPVVFERLSGIPVEGGNSMVTVTKGTISGTVTISNQGVISVKRN